MEVAMKGRADVATAGPTGWQLEGNAAEAYERYLVPALFAAWADRLVALAGVRPGERVLDVACGTGIVARRAAARVAPGGSVTGLDVNEGMLAVARRASAEVRPAVEWRHGDAAALPFADGVFDVVFSEQALQFFPDPVASLREMRRVSAAPGRVAVSVCRPIEFSPAYAPLADALARHAGASAGAMMRSPFAPWTIDDVRAHFTAAGLRDVRVTIDVAPVRYPSAEEFLRREASSSPLAGPIGALGEAARRDLVQDVVRALRPHTDDDGVSFPIESWFVLARR
jgi:SAM-dependent methyltransferase